MSGEHKERGGAEMNRRKGKIMMVVSLLPAFKGLLTRCSTFKKGVKYTQRESLSSIIKKMKGPFMFRGPHRAFLNYY